MGPQGIWTMGHWAGYVVEERWFFGVNEGIEAHPASLGIEVSSSLLQRTSPPGPALLLLLWPGDTCRTGPAPSLSCEIH